MTRSLVGVVSAELLVEVRLRRGVEKRSWETRRYYPAASKAPIHVTKIDTSLILSTGSKHGVASDWLNGYSKYTAANIQRNIRYHLL